ncbi:MAG: hypothetical protein CVU34_04940 [Betaproteobacteria bacterium HGW-Betaproteobacteria-7]|nr:MAG: hypothetical protein CVU34_04940 [Betaproteobacteria bacterium HGW-Betaproteobacteria-7]
MCRLAEKLLMHELMKVTGHKDTRMLARYYHPGSVVAEGCCWQNKQRPAAMRARSNDLAEATECAEVARRRWMTVARPA